VTQCGLLAPVKRASRKHNEPLLLPNPCPAVNRRPPTEARKPRQQFPSRTHCQTCNHAAPAKLSRRQVMLLGGSTQYCAIARAQRWHKRKAAWHPFREWSCREGLGPKAATVLKRLSASTKWRCRRDALQSRPLARAS